MEPPSFPSQQPLDISRESSSPQTCSLLIFFWFFLLPSTELRNTCGREQSQPERHLQVFSSTKLYANFTKWKHYGGGFHSLADGRTSWASGLPLSRHRGQTGFLKVNPNANFAPFCLTLQLSEHHCERERRHHRTVARNLTLGLFPNQYSPISTWCYQVLRMAT